MTTSLQQLSHIRAFPVAQIEHTASTLVITLRDYDIMLAVIDEERQIMAFDHFESRYKMPTAAYRQWLENILQHSDLTNFKWRNTLVVAYTDYFVFIPKEFYTSADAQAFLRLNCRLPSDLAFYTNELKDYYNYCYFGLQQGLVQTLTDYLPEEMQVIHGLAAFVGGQTNTQALAADALIVTISKQYVGIQYYDHEQLKYMNAFRYETAEDFLYYILFVMEEMQVRPEKALLIVHGITNGHEAHLRLAKQYIQRVQHAEVPASEDTAYIKTHPLADAVPASYLTDIAYAYQLFI